MYTCLRINLPVDAPESPENVDSPFPASLPKPPRIVGRNIAINTDLMSWAPRKTGNMSFLRKNAKIPIPNPAKNELLPEVSEN